MVKKKDSGLKTSMEGRLRGNIYKVCELGTGQLRMSMEPLFLNMEIKDSSNTQTVMGRLLKLLCMICIRV